MNLNTDNRRSCCSYVWVLKSASNDVHSVMSLLVVEESIRIALTLVGDKGTLHQYITSLTVSVFPFTSLPSLPSFLLPGKNKVGWC